MNIRRTETPVALNAPVPVASQAPAQARAQGVPSAIPSSFDGTVNARQGELLRPADGSVRPTTSILPGDMKPVAPGPVSLNSRIAQDAVNATQQYLSANLHLDGPGRETGLTEFVPAKVEIDQLGMTHVRMDRMQDGMKVFGEQVIAHLNSEGKVVSLTGGEVLEPIPAQASRTAEGITAAQACTTAEKSFGKQSQFRPVVEQVLFRKADGTYAKAFRVEVTDFKCDRPQRMNYMVDAKTGEVLDRWNQMGGIELPKVAGDQVDRPGRNDEITVTKTNEANAKIEDLGKVESKITVDDKVTAEQLKLDLDISHTYAADVKVTLTSPSGKAVVVQDRQGGDTHDIKGSFDLSAAFAGEQAQGEWTLTVEDLDNKDSGNLNSWGLTVTGRGEPKPQGDDTTLYSGKVDLGTTQNEDGTSKLLDTTRGNGVETRDAQNKSNANSSTEIADNNDLWGETSDPARNAAAVDAHYGGEMTYDFYKDVLGRNSIDGKGEKLVSNVHIRSNYVNAYWDGKTMNYGDGDGRTSGPLTTLDIAGHEITHGLTERTAGLIYRGESGGINESMSDIMGTGVEWYASQKNSAVKFDFTLGEDAWTPTNGDPNDGLRYMDDPTKDNYSVDNYKNYPKQTEVHGSSGIMNNAFYLMAQGGTNRTSGIEVKDGIGVEKSLQVFGRALMFYMTPSTTFAQARQACEKAAIDLFGADSVEVQKVRESWTAVGVN